MAYAGGHPKTVLLLLLMHCFFCYYHCVGGGGGGGRGSVFVLALLCFLVLQSSWWERASWLLYFNWLPDVLWPLVSCGSSSRCRGLICSVWFWYFLVKLTYLFSPSHHEDLQSYLFWTQWKLLLHSTLVLLLQCWKKNYSKTIWKLFCNILENCLNMLCLINSILPSNGGSSHQRDKGRISVTLDAQNALDGVHQSIR